MRSELTIGKVLKPRGLKGEVKIETYSSDPARFSRLKELKLDGVPYAVEKLTPEGAFCYVKFKGVDTVESAETLRNKTITVHRDALPKPPEGRYYIIDIIGLDVVVNGDVIGEITDVLQYGSADVYAVRGKSGNFSFPAVNGLIKDVDIKNGVMTLDGMLFDRVVVYN